MTIVSAFLQELKTRLGIIQSTFWSFIEALGASTLFFAVINSVVV
jgi:hypothetical protein